MKKLFIVSLSIAFLSACSGGSKNSGKALGEEVCDCSEKANAMDAADPKRSAAQSDCAKLQVDAWNKVKDNQQEADEFNKVLKERLEALLKKNQSK